MKIFVVGSGKLANAILASGLSFPSCEILPWEPAHQSLNERAILVHAGSGRQLQECIAYCERTGAILVELSTGLETETLQPKFTLIVCPNTSLLLLKTLHFMKLYGGFFANNEISITESHQASKTSAPGTAYSFADSLRFPHHKVKSIRDPEVQANIIGIPKEYLDKHAYHKIVIKDGTDEVTLETKVLGHNTYAQGVQKIIEAVLKNTFEPRRYSVIDLIEKGLV